MRAAAQHLRQKAQVLKQIGPTCEQKEATSEIKGLIVELRTPRAEHRGRTFRQKAQNMEQIGPTFEQNARTAEQKGWMSAKDSPMPRHSVVVSKSLTPMKPVDSGSKHNI